MVIDNIDGVPVDELELTEAKLFIKRLFVQGDYKHYADRFKINREDLKRILYEASAFLGEKNINCTIALILKSVDESREVFVSCTGTGVSFIINSDGVNLLNPVNIMIPPTQPDPLEEPQLFAGKLNKNDTLLLCSESLTALIELNFMQRIVFSSKNPKEVCEKLLHSVSGSERIDNISVAAFNGTITRRNQDKAWMPYKTILLIIIPIFLVLIGILIYNFSSGKKEQSIKTVPINAFETSKLPPEIKRDSTVQPNDSNTQVNQHNDIESKPLDNLKTVKKEIIKTPKVIANKYNNVKFIVNGSVVMISNWDLVQQEILYINWDKGLQDKKRIHKYLDYKRIPSSVKITYKDNSTKSYNIK